MMRLAAGLMVVVCGGLAIVAAQGKASPYRARLSPVPIDVAMQATIAGTGTVTATLTGARLTISGTFSGLKTPATVARVHIADKGLRGPAAFDLTVTPATSGALSGTVALTPAQVEDLAKSRFYIQIHSEKAPDGNLWGWLLPQEARR
jgi:hypothetical protein